MCLQLENGTIRGKNDILQNNPIENYTIIKMAYSNEKNHFVHVYDMSNTFDHYKFFGSRKDAVEYFLNQHNVYKSKEWFVNQMNNRDDECWIECYEGKLYDHQGDYSHRDMDLLFRKDRWGLSSIDELRMHLHNNETITTGWSARAPMEYTIGKVNYITVTGDSHVGYFETFKQVAKDFFINYSLPLNDHYNIPFELLGQLPDVGQSKIYFHDEKDEVGEFRWEVKGV